MTKKQIMSKQANSIKKERILWIVIIILAISQAISAWYLMKIWNYNSDSSQQSTYSLISKVEEKRYKYPVIDIAEGRVYIPEMRIYLPLNDSTRDLRYDFFNAPNYKSLRLSTSSAVGVQNDTDDPSCDKVVILSKSKEGASSIYYDAGEIKPTKDGLRYLSVHNKDTCSIYFGNIREGLVEAAKSITQY